MLKASPYPQPSLAPLATPRAQPTSSDLKAAAARATEHTAAKARIEIELRKRAASGEYLSPHARLVQEILAALPTPHPAQLRIMDSPAPRKVVNAGRRGGKTTVADMAAIRAFCRGKRVLLASASQDQADAFWEQAVTWLRPMIEDGRIYKNETKRYLVFADRAQVGRIKVKTAKAPDALRGDYADFMVLDECAMLHPDIWFKVAAPMLADHDGDVWFISTPRRRNWFFQLYTRAEADTSGRWAAFHFTSHDNPHLSEEALKELAKDLTEEDYLQEIMAVFLENEGAVFRNIDACMNAPLDARVVDHWQHRVVMGVDWAMERDFTVLRVLCATCMQELALDRFNKVDWTLQRGRLVSLGTMWRVTHYEIEYNSIGSPNFHELDKMGLPVFKFDTNSSTKPPLVQEGVLAFERETVQWLPDKIGRGEFMAFEQKINPQTGRRTYSAPEGMHDDIVMARLLALKAAMEIFHIETDRETFEQLVASSNGR